MAAGILRFGLNLPEKNVGALLVEGWGVPLSLGLRMQVCGNQAKNSSAIFTGPTSAGRGPPRTSWC